MPTHHHHHHHHHSPLVTLAQPAFLRRALGVLYALAQTISPSSSPSSSPPLPPPPPSLTPCYTGTARLLPTSTRRSLCTGPDHITIVTTTTTTTTIIITTTTTLIATTHPLLHWHSPPSSDVHSAFSMHWPRPDHHRHHHHHHHHHHNHHNPHHHHSPLVTLAQPAFLRRAFSVLYALAQTGARFPRLDSPLAPPAGVVEAGVAHADEGAEVVGAVGVGHALRGGHAGLGGFLERQALFVLAVVVRQALAYSARRVGALRVHHACAHLRAALARRYLCKQGGWLVG